MTRIQHARAVAASALTWCMAFMWLWPRAVRAETLSAEFKVYDWLSLAYAAALGLLGGGLALIVALATDRRVVLEVAKESGRNALVSPIAGAAAYLGLKSAASLGWFSVTTEPRFLVIVGSGWAGIAFLQWVRELTAAGAPKVRDGLINMLVSWLQRWSAGTKDKP